MKIKLASTAGFCMGVRRAMEIAQDAAKDSAEPVYTHGQLIHNRQAVEVLENQGIKAINDPTQLSAGRKIVIRAHGIPKKELTELKDNGVECIDATCPHVLKSQKRLEKDSALGNVIVLVGDKNHAEMVGLVGYCSGKTHVISTIEEAEALDLPNVFSVLAQTTFNAETYDEICNIFKKKYPECKIYHSICKATSDRQLEAMKLADECDCLVVVGGKHSANTCRLAEIGKLAGKSTFHVETAEELDVAEINKFDLVGVTAGASTPGWILQTVINKLEEASPSGFVTGLRTILNIFVKSYVFSALGAVSLALAVSKVINITISFSHLAIVFSYILSIYTINRYVESSRNAKTLSNVFKFHKTHKFAILSFSLVLAIISIILAMRLSSNLFILILIAYIAGVVYTIRILPKGFRYRCLKDIPASKDIFVSTAWTLLLIAIPVFSHIKKIEPISIIGAAGMVFLLVFGKTVALDLRDTEGDRLIGSETIPVLIGKKRTLSLLYLLQLIILILIIVFSVLSIFSIYGFALTVVPIYGVIYLRGFRKRTLTDELKCKAIVDGQIIISGIVVTVIHLILSFFHR